MTFSQTNLPAGSQGLKLVLENWALRFLTIGLVSLAFFSAGAGKWMANYVTTNAGTQENVNHFFGEIGFAFTIAAFLILTTERSAKRELQSQFSQYMEKICEDFRTSLVRFSRVEAIFSFLYKIDSATNTTEIRTLAEDIFDEYTTDLFKVEAGGFSIADRNWAMEAGKKFYATLQESQVSIANLEVRVTHSGSIKIWENEEDGSDSIMQQRAFMERKNATIKRIFIGTAFPPPKEYEHVMKMMSQYGIQTYYVQREHPERVPDMTWVPALKLRMTWNMRRGGNVAEINISADTHDRENLEVTWETLMEQTTGQRGRSGPVPQSRSQSQKT
jgi:hypothetical protein